MCGQGRTSGRVRTRADIRSCTDKGGHQLVVYGQGRTSASRVRTRADIRSCTDKGGHQLIVYGQGRTSGRVRTRADIS